jgi:hypothetical protein
LGREDGGGAGVVWGWTVQWWPGWGRFLVVEMAICCRDGHGYASCAVLVGPASWMIVISSDSHAYCFLQDSMLSMFQSNPLLRPHNFEHVFFDCEKKVSATPTDLLYLNPYLAIWGTLI